MTGKYDVVVIGAGVSGMTSALYLKRANFKVLLIDKAAPGGQINKTSKIENYPGFKKIDGPSLASSIFEQIQEMSIDFLNEEVISLNILDDKRIVNLKNKQIECSGIILASGREPNPLNIEKADKYIGKGISYCALCDGNFYKNKNVCIIGGGDSALEESVYLSSICNLVTIINRSEKLRANVALQKKALEKENIRIIYNSYIKEIIELDDKIIGLELNNGEKLSADGIFVYIGSKPKIDYLNGLNILKDNSYIIVDKNMRTNIKNIYACGDAIKKELYQIVTATSEGAIAANSFQKDMLGLKE